MKVSFKTGIQSGSVDEIIAVWLRAEQIDRFQGGWLNDHLYNPSFGSRDHRSDAFEAFAMIAALARETTRLRLGTLVVGNLFRHPALVARTAMTIDHLSGGRFELGLGAGWHEREHADHGIDLLAPGKRLDAFEEACQIIIGLLRHGTVSLDGEHYQVDGALLEPAPTAHIPILIGGGGERRTLRAAARFADHWNFGDSDPVELPHKLEVLRRHCADVGRDPDEIEISVQVFVSGDADGLRERAIAFRDAGAEHIIVALAAPEVTLLEQVAAATEDL